MRKLIASLFIAVFLTLSIATPLLADTRRYIGDEPYENYAVGRQGDLKDAITAQLSIIPGVFPNDPELRDQLIWIRLPANNYHFRTAPAVDQNYFSNKMEDAATSVQDAVANLIFGITRSVTLIANNLVLICFDNYVGEAMFSAIGDVVSTFTEFEEGGLMSLLFLIVLCVLGIGIAGFLIKAQLMRALSSVLIAVVCLACIVGYTLNVDKIIPAVINFTNNATGVALMATTYMQDMPVELQENASNDSTFEINTIAGSTSMLEQGLVETTNSIWHTLVGAPWAVGMFGNSNPNNLKLLPSEVATINKDLQKTFSVQLFGPDGVIDPEVNLDNLWDKLMPWKPKKELPAESYMDSVWLACSNDVKNSMLEAITNNQERYEGKAGAGGTAVLFTLGQGTSSAAFHNIIAFLSLFPSIIFLLFVFFVGVPVFIAQFVLMILLILLPFALLLGMSGEKGTQITLLYIKGLLGAAATKIIYGFYMSFILLFAVALNKAAADQFALGGFLISIIFVFAIKFRKTFFEGVMGILPVDTGRDYAGDAENWIKRTAGHFVTAYIGGKVADTNDAAKIAADARASNPNPQTRRGTGNPNPPNSQEGRSQTPGGQQNRNQTSGQGSAPPITPRNQEPGIHPPPGSDTSRWDTPSENTNPSPTQNTPTHTQQEPGIYQPPGSDTSRWDAPSENTNPGPTQNTPTHTQQEPGIHPPPGSDTSRWDAPSENTNPGPTQNTPTYTQQEPGIYQPPGSDTSRWDAPHKEANPAQATTQNTTASFTPPGSKDSPAMQNNAPSSWQDGLHTTDSVNKQIRPTTSPNELDESNEYIQANNPDPPTRRQL